MPTRDLAPLGAPCWTDLMTSDAEGAKAFYGELFGWVAEEPSPDFGGYFNFRKDDVRVAGCMGDLPSFVVPDVWAAYLRSADAQATVDATQARGGEVVLGPIAIDDLGRMAVIADPQGARIGVWEAGTHPGFGRRDEPGTPAWFELHTRDHDASVAFYRDVFGWPGEVLSDTADFRLTVMADGERRVAGIMDASGYLPPDVPNHWEVYFRVADVEASLTSVVRLGGAVLREARDTPFGPIATVADATGAAFKLIGAAAV
jgi:predicted enzyme related to lactoylglutathione lyase